MTRCIWSSQSGEATVDEADLVIGILGGQPLPEVIRSLEIGLRKYFPHFSAVIVESKKSCPVATAIVPLFASASEFRAKVFVLLDSRHHCFLPESIDLLVRPVLYAGFDLTSPSYRQHKHQGAIASQFVYPMIRALYGRRMRPGLSAEFALSTRLVDRFLSRNDLVPHATRLGLDIRLTTIALAGGFRTCQSSLGSKFLEIGDSGWMLSSALSETADSVFGLMEGYRAAWIGRRGSSELERYGAVEEVALDGAEPPVEQMVRIFCAGCRELGEIWSIALDRDTLNALQSLAADNAPLRFPDELWAQIVYDFSWAYRTNPLKRGYLLRSMIPLYLAKAASFALETREMFAAEVEQTIERLGQTFEDWKPHLESRWRGLRSERPHRRQPDQIAGRIETAPGMEVEL